MVARLSQVLMEQNLIRDAEEKRQPHPVLEESHETLASGLNDQQLMNSSAKRTDIPVDDTEQAENIDPLSEKDQDNSINNLDKILFDGIKTFGW